MDELVLTDSDEIIILESEDIEFSLLGDAGIQGAPGPGVPAGGTAGQYYRKASNANYDGEWVDGNGADANFIYEFNPTTSVTVTHNLGKYPAVTVITSAGDEVVADVDHVDTNQLTLNLGSAAFGGKVVCN